MSNVEQMDRAVSVATSIARVWAIAGPLRAKLVRGIAFRFAQSLFLGLSFAAIIWIITAFVADGKINKQLFWLVSAIVVISLIGQLVFGYLSMRDCWLASYEVVSSIRLNLLDHLRKLPMGFHMSRFKGDTVTALTSDLQTIEAFLSDALSRIAQAVGLPLTIICFLLTRDMVLAIAVSVSIIASAPVFLWSSVRLSTLATQRQDMQADVSTRMIEYVQGMSVIRAFNQMARGEEVFGTALQAFRDISILMVAKLVVPMVAFGAVLLVGIPFLMVVGGLRVDLAAVSPVSLISVLVLLLTVYTPLVGLAGVLELWRLAQASLERIDRIASSSPLPHKLDGVEPQGFAIEFHKVEFAYQPTQAVLSNISFVVPESSMTAIVGSSGSGKSTILNLIPRFWDVAQGSITIGGVDVRDMTPQVLAALTTVVFQDVYLFAGTIRDNIAFGRPEAAITEVIQAAKAAQAHDFISTLPEGYDTKVGEGGVNFSGGERQRISIARAILKDAPIVLLDEVTAAIDPTNERAIQEALANLAANRTLLVVAHRLSTIQAADQILVVERGNIVEQGKHKRLLELGGVYANLWNQRLQSDGWRISNQSAE